MKKLIVIIAILFLATTAFATESDPSETVGFVKYECITTGGTDLNALSLPLDAGYTMASELGDDIGVCDVVSKWDNAEQAWISASYSFGSWQGDFELESGYPYMINVTGGVDVYIAGGLPEDPVFDLITTTGKNLNFLMVPLSISDLAMASDLGDDIGVCDVVSDWNNVEQGWISASYSFGSWQGDYPIDIAKPLMVGVTEDTTWPTPESSVKNVNKIIKIEKRR